MNDFLSERAFEMGEKRRRSNKLSLDKYPDDTEVRERFVTDHGAGANAILGVLDQKPDQEQRLAFFRRRISCLSKEDRRFLWVLRRVFENRRGSVYQKRRKVMRILGLSPATYYRRVEKNLKFFESPINRASNPLFELQFRT